MRYLRGCLIVVILITAVGISSAGGFREPKIEPLRVQIAQAQAIVFGRFESPRKKGKNDVTDLVVHDVIKSHPLTKDQKVFVVPRNVTSEAMFVVFAEVQKGKLDYYKGFPADRHFIAYLRNIMKLDPKKPVEMLRFYFDYLQDPNDVIRGDAYVEFSQASPADFDKAARKLSAAQLSAWIRDPKTETYRLNLYAELLSYCGAAMDADEIAKMLEDESSSLTKGRNRGGALIAMLSLKPETYAPKLRDLAKDEEQAFVKRYSALRAVQYVHENRPDLHKKVDTLAMMADHLAMRDICEFAMENMRKWKRWEHTDQILGMFGKKPYNTRFTRKAILRFALQAPGPKAAAFIAKVRKEESEFYRDAKEQLELEMRESISK